MRIDKLLFDKNLVKSRQEAIGLILSGNVFIGSQRIDKPGTKVEMNCNLILKKKIKCGFLVGVIN